MSESRNNEENPSGEGSSAKNETENTNKSVGIENFDPIPYDFFLKDIDGNVLVLHPDLARNAIVKCPSFHVLFDHLVAVLWCFYSQKGLEKLGPLQIHWALKFLKGTKNRFGKLTEDILMAIKHLEDDFIEICDEIKDEDLDSREYFTALHSSRRDPSKDDLSKPETDLNTETINETTAYDEFSKNLRREQAKLNTISLILEDMLSTTNPGMLKQLLTSSVIELNDQDPVVVEIVPPKSLESGKPIPEIKSDNLNDSAITWRNEQIKKMMSKLAEFLEIDDTLKGLQCETDPALKRKLKELLSRNNLKD